MPKPSLEKNSNEPVKTIEGENADVVMIINNFVLLTESILFLTKAKTKNEQIRKK